MKTPLLCILPVILLLGCARFSTRQSDIRKEWWEGTNQFSTTEIITKASSYTLFSSKSDLANFKATQTEKSQGASVGSLIQQGGTNAVEVLRELKEIFMILGIKGATGL